MPEAVPDFAEERRDDTVLGTAAAWDEEHDTNMGTSQM
jgi:hypothetical protein